MINCKKPAKWIKLDLITDEGLLSALEGALITNRINSWIQEDGPSEVRLTVYLPEFSPYREILDSIKEIMPPDRLKIISSEICDENWENSWQQYYRVVRIGKNIVIKPPWMSHREEPGDLVIEIEPRMAFGSGYHPTTSNTLTLIEEFIRPGDRVLDMGCGSGILGIAAARMKAGSVVMADYDEICVRESRENYRLAREKDPAMTESAEFIHSDGFSSVEGPFDLTAVNVHAGFILQSMEDISRVTWAGGFFVTGSINDGREAEVIATAEKAGFTLKKTIAEEGWTGLAFQK